MNDITSLINRLLHYALRERFIHPRDLIHHQNNLLKVLQLNSVETDFIPTESTEDIEDILQDFILWAIQNGRISSDPTTEEKDLFDTKIIGCLLPTPSLVEQTFWKKYQSSPKEATDFYYHFSQSSNYIRRQRIAKDEKWSVHSPYGDIHISINLSKPEKDPRDIAKAKSMSSFSYPSCLLCAENENYAGRIGHPARDNHRLIELKLHEEKWFFQYSPYVYYNEHCIVLKSVHEPMKLNYDTFCRMMHFLDLFPHYFIGSNADLPIVGGSILSHDHFQGGSYVFPMEIAEEIEPVALKHHDVTVSLLNWPVSVLRLRGKDPAEISKLSDILLHRWREYSDESLDIYSHTDDIPHNTITPIARLRNGTYEIDLALRNNKTTEKRPFGLFHPRESLHHIKKENIGLIEVMGLAILPSRLKSEMKELESLIVQKDIDTILRSQHLAKHANFALSLMRHPKLSSETIETLIQESIGAVFVQVLEDAGVFKTDDDGRQGFRKAREVLLENL